MRGGRGGALRKNFEKSKNFFENPGRFRKKSDYIGEGHFRRRAMHGVRGGRGGFLSKSGNEFPFLVSILDKPALVW